VGLRALIYCYGRFGPLLAKDARNWAPAVGNWRRTAGSSWLAALARRNDNEFLKYAAYFHYRD